MGRILDWLVGILGVNRLQKGYIFVIMLDFLSYVCYNGNMGILKMYPDMLKSARRYEYGCKKFTK